MSAQWVNCEYLVPGHKYFSTISPKGMGEWFTFLFDDRFVTVFLPSDEYLQSQKEAYEQEKLHRRGSPFWVARKDRQRLRAMEEASLITACHSLWDLVQEHRRVNMEGLGGTAEESGKSEGSTDEDAPEVEEQDADDDEDAMDWEPQVLAPPTRRQHRGALGAGRWHSPASSTTPSSAVSSTPSPYPEAPSSSPVGSVPRVTVPVSSPSQPQNSPQHLDTDEFFQIYHSFSRQCAPVDWQKFDGNEHEDEEKQEDRDMSIKDILNGEDADWAQSTTPLQSPAVTTGLPAKPPFLDEVEDLDAETEIFWDAEEELEMEPWR